MDYACHQRFKQSNLVEFDQVTLLNQRSIKDIHFTHKPRFPSSDNGGDRDKKEGIRLSPKPDPVYKTNLTNRHEKIFSNVWCKYKSLNHFNKTNFKFFS